MSKKIILAVLLVLTMVSTCRVNVQAYTNETSNKIEEAITSRHNAGTCMLVVTNLCHNYPISNKAYESYVTSCNEYTIETMDYLH